MPTINLLPKKKRTYDKRGKSDFIWKNVYNTIQWRKLREAHLCQHPLCELCLQSDRVTPAVEVHHIREISTGESAEEMLTIGFDADNLMSLCEDCHTRLHAEKHKKK